MKLKLYPLNFIFLRGRSVVGPRYVSGVVRKVIISRDTDSHSIAAAQYHSFAAVAFEASRPNFFLLFNKRTVEIPFGL